MRFYVVNYGKHYNTGIWALPVFPMIFEKRERKRIVRKRRGEKAQKR